MKESAKPYKHILRIPICLNLYDRRLVLKSIEAFKDVAIIELRDDELFFHNSKKRNMLSFFNYLLALTQNES
jgi:hypothetical protein